ncbi:MAG: hypothetical protein ACYCQJ_05590 [Nitrososphaerales archaeon]
MNQQQETRTTRDYIEIAIGQRHHVPAKMVCWDEFKTNPSPDVDFTSAYRFQSEDPYVGPVISNFYMDFDYESDPDQARKECLKTARLFKDLGVPQNLIRLVFSGKKGFWLFIPKGFFGAEARDDLPLVWRTIAESIRDIMKLKTVDTQIYHRRCMIRLNNRKYPGTGLYRIPVKFEEINAVVYKVSMDDIREFAKEPRNDFIIPEYSARPLDSLQKLYEKSIQIIEERKAKYAEREPIQTVSSLESLPVWLRKRLDTHIPEGSGKWNISVFQTSVALAQYGIPKDVAIKTVMAFAEPRNDQDRREIERSFESAYKGVLDHKYSVTCFSDAFIEFSDLEEPKSAILNQSMPLQQLQQFLTSEKSSSVKLVQLAKELASDFFLDQTNKPYAWFRHQTDSPAGYPVALRSQEFRSRLLVAYYKKFDQIPGPDAINNAVNLLTGSCHESKKRHELGIRCTMRENELFIDVADVDWHAWRITKDGVSLSLQETPMFKRYEHMRQLKEPNFDGTLEDVKAFFNYYHVKTSDLEDDLVLLVGYIGAAFVANISHCILVVWGAQGAAKTSFTKALRTLVDPTILTNAKMPKEDRELVQFLAHHYVPCFDNVSYIEDENKIDELCRAATGDAFSKRELYSDDEDFIYQFKHLPMFNGLNIPFDRGDILDRTLPIEIERIKDVDRRLDSEVEAYLETAIPKVLGAIFKGLSKTMGKIDLVSQELNGKLPRMADFCVWAEAFCQAMGYEKGLFVKRFNEKMEDNAKRSVEGDCVSELIQRLVSNQNEWSGSASDLLAILKSMDRDLGLMYKESLPNDPRKLGRIVNDIRIGMSSLGINIQKQKGTHGTRMILISKPSLDSLGGKVAIK